MVDLTYVVVSVASGVLFGIMDGVINANPLASQLYAVYNPIARTSINLPGGIMIDLLYGFVMAAIFLLLYEGLPGGEMGVLKGASYGLIMWFFRVVMAAASQWVMFDVPLETLLYTLTTGLVEMLVLGIFYGLLLHPAD